MNICIIEYLVDEYLLMLSSVVVGCLSVEWMCAAIQNLYAEVVVCYCVRYLDLVVVCVCVS